jgi:hypothetical protein
LLYLQEDLTMSWQKQVAGGFGANDCLFAVHSLDEKRAKDAIKAAKAAGATRDDFEKEMVWHIYKNVTADGALQGHLATELAKLDKLW